MKKNTKKALIVFYLFLGILLTADFFIKKHGDFYWENYSNFFAVYGFISCILLIFIAKIISPLIKRDENYYDKK